MEWEETGDFPLPTLHGTAKLGGSILPPLVTGGATQTHGEDTGRYRHRSGRSCPAAVSRLHLSLSAKPANLLSGVANRLGRLLYLLRPGGAGLLRRPPFRGRLLPFRSAAG